MTTTSQEGDRRTKVSAVSDAERGAGVERQVEPQRADHMDHAAGQAVDRPPLRQLIDDHHDRRNGEHLIDATKAREPAGRFGIRSWRLLRCRGRCLFVSHRHDNIPSARPNA